MECLKLYVKNVQEYFALLEETVTRTEELLKKSVKPCSTITNQCLILHAALKKDSLVGTGLDQFPNFGQLLSNCVLISLNKEVDTLFYIRDEITSLGKDLLEKYKVIEESFKTVKQNNIVQSSLLNPISPRLEHITDWCLDVWRYYHSLHLQISIPLENLNLENEESVKALRQAFKEDKYLKTELNRIRSYELQSFPFIE